jgi:glycosyltransferase involved in cell wall biosynthesis
MAARSVSIVLPTRDRWPMFSQALRSALDQRGVDHEVIVVDEGSADRTPSELARVDDDRLVVVRHDAPEGVARARNDAIAVAKGEWIAFLDDDDLLAPDNLRTQLVKGSDADVVMLYSGRVEVSADLTVQHMTPPRDPQNLAHRLLIGNVIGPPSGVLVRSDALARAGGFDESFSAVADWDLWIRLARQGEARASPEPLLAYRRHAGSMTVAKADGVLDEFERLSKKHAALAASEGVAFGGNFVGSWLAGRELAEGRRIRAALSYGRMALAERSGRDVLRALAALGGRPVERIGRALESRATDRPEWLERYA